MAPLTSAALYQSERLANARADPVVALMGCIIDEGLYFHYIKESILPEYCFINLHIHDLADKLSVQADFDRMQQSALKDYRKLGSKWSIHQLTPDRGQTGNGKLVHVTP